MEGNFTPEPAMALAGIAILPVFVWFVSRKITLKLFLFGGLLLLLFSRGTLEIAGVSTSLVRIAVEGLVLACFLLALLMSQSSKKKLPGLFVIMAFSLVSFASIVFNDTNTAMLLLFFRDYLFSIIFFYAVLNISFSDREARLIFRLITYLLVSQVFANLIKILVVGDIIEPYIGTMANLGGSLTIIFSLLGSVISISMYLNTRRNKYLLMLVGFIVFSIIGGKRAALVFIPFVYLFLLFVHQIQGGVRVGHVFRQMVIFTCVCLVFFYTSLRLMPSLNPEREVWGSFDVEHAINYSTRYVTTGAGAIEKIGRAQAPAYLLTRAASDSTLHLLLGYGAGHLIKSRFNALVEDFGSQSDISMNLYGVGYGARTGFLQLFLQVGLVGVVLYLALWFRIFKAIYANFKKYGDPQNVRIRTQFLLGISLVFLVDFFTYSVIFVQLGVISVTVALILSTISQGQARIQV